MIPNYLQTWGLARAYAERADPFYLVESADRSRWELDLDSLAEAVAPETGLIIVTNPNNPTGAVLNEAENGGGHRGGTARRCMAGVR